MFLWLLCYLIGGLFALIAVGGWAYCALNMLRIGMLGRSRTMAQTWPYIRRMLWGLAAMIVAAAIGSPLFNLAAERLFGS